VPMLNKCLLPNFTDCAICVFSTWSANCVDLSVRIITITLYAFLQFLIIALRFDISAMLEIHFRPVGALGSQANNVLLRRVLVPINV